MTLLTLSFAIKLLALFNFFKYIDKKHERLGLEDRRSLEKVRRKGFKISKNVNFIKKYKNEDLLPTFVKVKLPIKSGNKKMQQNIVRLIISCNRNYNRNIARNINSNVK